MVGRDLGHFQVLEPLGAGGMGEVYRAHDTRLKRDVAIKLLPEKFTADPDRRARLRREAHLLASLNHPGVEAIHSLEEVGGTHFLVLELIEGQTLAERLAAGPLPVGDALEFAGQIAAALEAAHDKGIVHRDLKPANVKITAGGVVKVLDFGLATLGPAGYSQRLSGDPTATVQGTSPGVILGTVPYMSPEQARGEEVDKRTDVWAFGCLLYEMLAARRAFAAATAPETMVAVLKGEPAWAVLPPDLPPAVVALLRRCLRKNSDQRLHDIADARIELEDVLRSDDTTSSGAGPAGARRAAPQGPARRRSSRLGVWALLVMALAGIAVLVLWGLRPPWFGLLPPGPGRIESIAVLPFDNLMNDAEQDYFVAGIQEALITSLAKIDTLRVISRTSAVRYKDSGKPLTEIARELGVDALLEGTVLRTGGQVRITAQLIDGRSDEHLWAESYDRTDENLLGLLSEVARAVALEVEISLTPRQQELLRAGASIAPAAYESYLMGQYHLNRASADGFRSALTFHLQAAELDPSFAAAWGSLAMDYAVQGYFGLEPRMEVVPALREAAARALRIDDREATGHAALGVSALYFDWDWETAEEQLRLALELDPTSSIIRHAYADYLGIIGDCEGSVRQVQRGRQYDPMGALANTVLLGHLVGCRRYEEAVVQGRQMVDLFPQQATLRQFLAGALWQLGSYEEALTQYRETRGEDSRSMLALERGYAAGGPRAARLAYAEHLEELAQAEPVEPFTVAAEFALAGERDRAFEWLARAVEERAPYVLHLRHPFFDSLRSDPRYLAVLNRIGLSK